MTQHACMLLVPFDALSPVATTHATKAHDQATPVPGRSPGSVRRGMEGAGRSLCDYFELPLKGDNPELHQPPAVVPGGVCFGVLLQGHLCQLQLCLDCRISCLGPMLSLHVQTEALLDVLSRL